MNIKVLDRNYDFDRSSSANGLGAFQSKYLGCKDFKMHELHSEVACLFDESK